MDFKAQIMNKETMGRAISRISHEITEKNDGVNDIVIIGVKRKGVPLAKAIVNNLFKIEGVSVPMGEIDITDQRDDYDENQKRLRKTDSYIPCDINDKTVIIVDDVLYTGRTIKAALETIFRFGRPKKVQLVVLVDRGHRELPIRPDYIGKNVPTSKHETVLVKYEDDDCASGVYIL